MCGDYMGFVSFRYREPNAVSNAISLSDAPWPLTYAVFVCNLFFAGAIGAQCDSSCGMASSVVFGSVTAKVLHCARGTRGERDTEVA